jgi:hypothetical protein
MSLVIRHVPIQYVNQAWSMVERFISDAQQHCGDDYTVDQVKVYVSSGQWLLVVAADDEGAIHGAATVSFSNYPNDRVAFVTFIGGKLISNKDTFGQFKDLLKANGATKIQGAAREAIARLWSRYGFEERYRIVETKI